MQTVNRSSFTTITTEGAILPADLLQRIVDGRELDGLRPEDYHLAPNERINEAISRSWNRLLGVWEGFNEQRRDLPAVDRGTTLTRDRWLLILLQELGYGRLPFQGSIALDGDDEESARYPISHEYDRLPLHLVSFRQPLDRMDPDRSERFRRSPHSLLQEFLNRSNRHLWGIVSNGLRLRVLRDNASFTRAAYLEFDLEAMMEGELYADFTLLWLTVHQSRLEGEPAACRLEKWSQEAAELGTRALDSLRDGVQEAIATLGHGFLAHPANGQLRRRLQGGELSTQDYYRRLLRLVYRLIFLFVAEDRNLLLVKEADADAREQYYKYYSVSRLRDLAARRRSGPHPDLYRSLRLVMVLLREGYPALGLPGLGGYLFSERSTPGLDDADIANEALLDAIRALAFTVENRVLRPVDYKNLGAEELGSVYESLLELHPELNVTAATFDLRTAAGSERRTTGSYYTPTSLINSLLDTALEPVVADRLRGKRGKDAEEALLDIKVVDPAAGSGHFLIAAANRLARHLARVRTGDEEPSPEANRLALRDVVRHCIYGVDINEMAVELCKVGLWLETLDPGKPLSFLERNIQCGNSLIGATPALLEGGVPDEAFKPITGDDEKYCANWRKQNKIQREGQLAMTLNPHPWNRLGNLADAMSRLDGMYGDTLEEVRAQEEAYIRLVQSGDYEYGRLLADAWCAAFVWVKKEEDAGGWPYPITQQVLRNLEYSPHTEPKWLKEEVRRLAGEYQFFHWHLAFPHVFGPSPGFDVVLGNPPWERIKLQEKEWFAGRDEAIATAPNAAARRLLIAALPQTNPALHEAFEADKRKAEGDSHFVRNSGKFPLCGRGDVNTYTLFAELVRQVQSGTGRVGVIVPSGIATDDTTKFYFQDIMDRAALVSLYDFENRNAIFPGVHRSYKFCLLTLTGEQWPAREGAQFVFFALDTADLRDEQRRFTLSAADIALLNPNTRTCPIFRSKRDAELTKGIYRRVPVLIKEGVGSGGMGSGEENPWGISFLRMFDMSNDSGLFRTREQLEAEGYVLRGNVFGKGIGDEGVGSRGVRETPTPSYLPLYEAKMLHHFDHRWATYEGLETRDVTPAEKNDPAFTVLPRYWVREDEVESRVENNQEWLLAFRNIARSTDERSALFSTIPKSGVGNSAPIVNFKNAKQENALLAAAFSSYVFDFITRFSLGGINFNFFIVKQLPALSPQTYFQPFPWAAPTPSLPYSLTPPLPITYSHWLLPRILELTYTAYDLRPYAKDCGYYGPPFRWDEERRFLLRCELDAAYFHLYGIARDDVDYIMDTFPIVRRKDEAAHGEYRTKRVILEIYDEMAEAMATGQPYQTRLDPPPGHPDAAHPWDEKYLGPELPRDQWWRKTELPEPVERAEPTPVFTSSPVKSVVKEPSPTFELKPPPTEQAQSKAKPPTQPAPIPHSPLPTPSLPYSQRLKRIMALGQPKSRAELQELVAALGDESENIRWLAGSTLVRIGGPAVREMLATYLATEPGEAALAEVQRVLALIEEVS